MSTNYYEPRDPFLRVRRIGPTAADVDLKDSGVVTVVASSAEAFMHGIRCFFNEGWDDASCAARVTHRGLSLRNRFWPDDFLLLSEYGELVAVGDLKNANGGVYVG